jgi:hypothetical protein
MSKDSDFGTNEDGSLNDEYCSFCFKDGKFLDEGITMGEKIDKLVEITTTKLNISEDQARELANSTIPHLKRWRQ